MSTLCAPLLADGGTDVVAIAEEVCFGQVPSPVTLREVPRRSLGIDPTREIINSDIISSNRGQPFVRHGPELTGGDLVTEVAPGVHAEEMAATLGGWWVTPDVLNFTALTGSGGGGEAQISTLNLGYPNGNGWRIDISMTAGEETSVVVPLGIRVGDRVKIEGTGIVELDDVVGTILTIGTGIVVIFPDADFSADVNSTDLTAGTLTMVGARASVGNVRRSFVVERWISSAARFMSYHGQKFNSAAFNIAPGEIVTGTYNLVGQSASGVNNTSVNTVGLQEFTETNFGSLTYSNPTEGPTIVASGGDTDFITEGFEVGDVILIERKEDMVSATSQNRNPRTITEVVDSATLRVAEAVNNGTFPNYTLSRAVDPGYDQAPTVNPLVGAQGNLAVGFNNVATVTAATINIDNSIGGPSVIGSNERTALFYGRRMSVTGTLTILFDYKGAAELLINSFKDEEQNLRLTIRVEDHEAPENFVQFFMREIVITSHSISDATDEGKPVEIGFTARVPEAGSLPTTIASPIIIQDGTMSGPLPGSGSGSMAMAMGGAMAFVAPDEDILDDAEDMGSSFA